MGAFLGPVETTLADISNTATAVGSSPSGTTNSSPVTASVPVSGGAPALLLTVLSAGTTDANNNGQTDIGDQVNFIYSVKNTGNVTLTNITLADSGVTITGGPIASLAPGGVDAATFTGKHTITLLDMLAHSYTDAATVTGHSGASTVTANGGVTTSLSYSASLSLTVSGAFATTNPKAGDLVNYTYTVRNTGLSLLTNVVLNDPLFAFNDTGDNSRMIALMDGASKTDAPQFATASLDGHKPHSGIVEASNRRFARRTVSAGLVHSELNATRQLVRMSGKSGPLEAGEKIGFLFSLTNAGDVPLTGLRIDQPDSLAYGSDVSLLNPNETDSASIIYTRDVTADEIASGAVMSNAYVSWTLRGRENVMQLRQSLALSGIKAYDDFKTASIFPISIPILGIGQSQAFTQSHALQQSEIDAGTVTTRATVSGLDIASRTVTQNGSMTMGITQLPAITLVKTGTITPADGVSAKVGDKINYRLSVSNPGNVTLSNVTITDPAATVTGTPFTLAPGVTNTTAYTAQYTLTQADIDRGSFQNQATASGTPPSGNAVTALSDYADPTQHRPTVTAIVAKPAIGLLKKVTGVTDVNNNGRNDVGDKIQYQFTAYNLGNVTLSNVTVTDTPNGGANVTIAGSPLATLAPGASNGSITGTYTITQADMDAGHVDNTATVTGKAPDNTIVTHDSDPNVPTQSAPTVTQMNQQAQVALYKKLASFDDVNGDGLIDQGDVLHYSFIVQNTGNVSLVNLRLTDLLSGVTVTGNSNTITLAAGASDSTTFTATYTVTAADGQAGVVHNSARIDAVQSGSTNTVNAVSRSGDLSQSSAGTTDTTVQVLPAIGLMLQAPSYADTNNDGVINAGDTLSYLVQLKNLSSISMNAITVVDNAAGLSISGTFNGTLLPGAVDTTSFTASHVLTPADVTLGRYDAQGKATATLASGPNSQITGLSDPSDFTQHRVTSYVLPASPQIAVFKKQASVDDVNHDGITDAGDVIHYSFIVQNTGNVPLDNIRLTDALTGATVVGNSNTLVLAPGANDSTTFTATYAVTPADEQAGVVHNRATADARQQGTARAVSAVSRDGDLTSSADNTTDTIIKPTPTIAILLGAPTYADTNNDGLTNVGDTLTYPVQVKNLSSQNFGAVTLSDAGSGLTFTGTLNSLAAGATDTSAFTAKHLITAADLVVDPQVGNAHYDAQAQARTTLGQLQISALSDPTDFTQHRVTRYNIVSVAQISATLKVDSFQNPDQSPATGPVAGGFIIYKITIWNSGNEAFSNVGLQFNGNYTGTITGATPFALAAGAVDSTHFALRHQISNAEILAGQIDNQLMATGILAGGGGSVTDLTDPQVFNANAVTAVTVVPNKSIALVLKDSLVEDTNHNGIVDAGDIIHYQFLVKNTGNVDLTNVTLVDPGAVRTSASWTIASLPVGAEDTTSFTAIHTITDQDVISGGYSNQASVSARFDATPSTITGLSDNTSYTALAKNPTVTKFTSSKTVFTVTASRSQVKRGEAVGYTISAIALPGNAYQVADIMPPGFAYVGGSAKLNGVAITPVVKGQTLTFNNVAPVNGKFSITLTLTASATLSGGKYVNNAKLVNQPTNALLASAQATIEVMPEATFDCADILGRVFDDLNGDGYQQDGEPGLAAVRIATVNGLLITTDLNGRFHVPCADIPEAAIGSNFIMKLDTRSLPAGYKVTTENPRDVRLTRGKATELNFGAGRTHQVKVDFNAQAFAQGSSTLTPRWSAGVAKLVDLLKSRRSDLLLVYHQDKESGEMAQARVDAVMGQVKQAWIKAGEPYALSIKFNMEPLP